MVVVLIFSEQMGDTRCRRIEEKDRTNSDLKKIFSMAIFQKLFNMEE